MPKTLLEVQDEFSKWKEQYGAHPDVAKATLEEYAKLADESARTPGERESAYNPKWYNKANALVDRGFQATGVPQISGKVLGGLGSLVDETAGTHIAPTVQRLGEDLPRMLVESIATIPAGPAGEAAVWAPRLRALAKVAGYGGAGLSGYSQTDSPLGAAINAGSMYGMNKLLLPAELGGMEVGNVAADAIRKRLGATQTIEGTAGRDLTAAAPELERFSPMRANVLPTAGAALAEAGTVGAVNEATRQASLSVGPYAVGLTDPERNPLTQENIAGQVVNALPFAGQAAMGLRHASGFDPRAVKGVHDWIQERRRAVEAEPTTTEGVSPVVEQEMTGKAPTDAQATFDLTEELKKPTPKFTPEEQSTLVESIRTHLDTAKMARNEGNVVEADILYAKAKALLETAGTTEDAVRTTQQAATSLDTEARQMPPRDATGLAEFTQKVNGLIDFWNENRAKVESGEMKAGPTSGPTQAYHPNARDPMVVERLQGKGLLEKITPEWLKSEWNATFDDTGSPQFASDVVAQKVANRFLDNLPEALKKESALPVVEAPVTPEATKVNENLEAINKGYKALFDAIGKISEVSPKMGDSLIKQTLDYMSEAPRDFVTPQGNVLKGIPATRVAAWIDHVVEAASTYNPVTQKAWIYGKEQPISVLWQAVPELGLRKVVPALKALKTVEGGKKRGVLETSLESMVAPENVLPEGEKTVVEQAGEAGLSGDPSQGALFRGRESEAATPMEETIPAEETKQFNDRFLKDAETYRKTVEALTPKQASTLIRGVFSGGLGEFREIHAKTILQAVVEMANSQKGDAVGPAGKALVEAYKASGKKDTGFTDRRFLDVILKSIFKSDVPADEAMAKSKGEPGWRSKNMYAWMRKVTDRVLDPKAVEAAKTYAGPMKMAGEPGAATDLLVNQPQAGDFVPDVYRTIRDAVTKKFGEKGMMGSYRELAGEMAVAIAKQASEGTDFYKIAKGPRGLAWDKEGRGQVGLNVDTPTDAVMAQKWVHDIMNTLAHEISHIDEYIALGMLPKPDAFSEERARQLRNIRSLAETLDPSARQVILSTLESGLRPPTFESVGREKDTGMTYGSSKPEEFTAVVHSLVMQSLLFGKEKGLKSAMDVLDYSPVEVQEFAQGTYRHVRDVLDALKETIANPDVRSALPVSDNLNRYVTSEAFDAVVNAARYAAKVRDAQKELAEARTTIENFQGKIPVGPTEATWYRRQEDVSKYMPNLVGKALEMSGALGAIDHAVEVLGVRYGKQHELSTFVKWFAPFSNKMDMWRRKGVDVAGPLADLVIGTDSAIYRTRSDILRPWLKKNPDGTLDWNTDNTFVGSVQKDPRVREAFNEVSRWQHENQGTMKIGDEVFPTMEPMFVVGQDGNVIPNPNHSKNAFAAWAEMSKNMPADVQQKVMAGSVAADQTHQIMAARSVGFMSESATIRVARMLQAYDPTLPSGVAHEQAAKMFDAFLNGQVASLGGTTRPEVLQAVGSFLDGPIGNIRRFEKLAQARPGFRTESLPGEYIIMYKNADDEVKFASAPDEHRARYVMNKVERQGGTLIGENPKNRNDLRGKFQDFDSPEAVVERAAFLENEAWKKAVDGIRAAQGDQIADELMRAYTPMTSSLKDVTSQGFRKFFEKAESQVDPQNLDYLDAMFARAGRLAASGVFHVNSAMKDLLLNDPRARMFPSLGQVIREQWDHVTSPTDMTTRKLKGLTAGYYMGASLGNAMMELSQGVSMFVPRIVATNEKGGFAKAYGQLFTAIGETANMAMSKEWQRLAALAERKDPMTLDVPETRALMMKRATENGVIGHNIIGEIFSSRDLQVQQKAKFGEGDYGPRSMTDLVTNGLYVGSQVMTGIYSWAARANDRIAFMMGVNQGIEQGLKGDALYNHARNFHQLVQGGGKADAPGLVTKFAGADPGIRSAVGLVYTLQHYGTKMVATYAQLGSEAIDSSKSLSPAQRVQARKAFLGFLATQTAIAGALGMPFAGAALTILEDQFGVPVKETVRKVLASLGSGDEDSWFSGSSIAETAMNGVVNQMLGMDVSSRLGVSNVFGTSSYRGFNLSDMFGPAPSIVENTVKSLNYFGQNEPMMAAKALVPQAFKNLISMTDSQAKYGDYAIRDQQDALLYKPTPQQSIGLALGFRPRESSQKQQAQQLLSSINKRTETTVAREQSDLAAKLLAGDPTAAQQYARELRYQDPTVKTDDVLRAILEKAVSAVSEKDLMASGSRRNADERAAVMGTFGRDVNPRQSEMQMTQLRTQLAARLGSPALLPNGEAWSRAAVVDGMVAQSGGKMPRSQALALVRMMGL